MTHVELQALPNGSCPNGKATQTIESRGVHERSIGIKIEMTNGDCVYVHPENYTHITVVR